ncbi:MULTISPECIES: LolA family protein [Cellulophaga]|jgi:outer membrane lipoprotein-sorting protein|uniref:Outer membrane lipoprotein-sorting protein n=1 Tax=Cellulophaga baltica TaxID=76594 RepID=A0A1G7HFE7_9FLAO|nr:MULTISPECIES: outer membrane lipoprotein carrier protein LolA [Cellulophaga]WFO16850.1 outer membrane lipoprotein carrier protein LolA [Cellulophaga baltica 4]AIY14347.1 membrane protein [Cellulophaga baltica NN016038]KGK30537.1 membrane protein [Cellulophaga sp. E6(2014)]QXP52885.1 outer membrane lipoprotein carrier protein LolA [Cellulophaga sp. HaHa_2_1]QXP54841.1 outer membrane lipoprotein carrier protein LolA [Cellulophaga sp. HaHa_2_95]
MKKIIVLVALFTSALSMAQSSAKAKTLLDDVYNKVKSYDNIYVDFKYALNNKEANINQETRGDVTMKGDKYLFNYLGSQQLFDGSKVYTIVPENEEVTIEAKSTEENTITPSKMLTFYKKGHNYEMDILQTIQGRKIQFVKLTPIDTNSEIKSILLGIDAETKHIYKLIETGKNGTKTTITVNSFKTNQTLSKTLFTFDEAKYKKEGYYIIRN